MIPNINSAALKSAYAFVEPKENQKLETKSNISKQGDMSKIEKIKESLQNGEYQVNLQALSEKIADELL
ncbi:MAG: flagellar biosynthesis anti-sigma factor FlgM [Sulfurimonadaceae bacterium]|jgi:anti-sigma28 factor (negative regulator of flagellin synthesis)|nr:flagellar biosynthesis anti-sigma factor FlgM [Sulfurimonadaceae bacterium]